MSNIARAFTSRRVKMSLELAQEARERNAMQKNNANKTQASSTSTNISANNTRSSQEHGNVLRPKISGPLELIHTTNMLSYNAPDLPRPSTSSAASTKSSDAESDSSSGTPTSDVSSPPTSPDVAPEELADRSISPEPNHLSCYFQPPVSAVSRPSTANTTVSSAAVQAPSSNSSSRAPAIPTRAPSHTKKASFDAISRQRSASTLSKESSHSAISSKPSFSFSRSSSGSTTASSVSSHSSVHMHHNHHKMSSASPISNSPAAAASAQTPPRAFEQKTEDAHPFGHELAKVTEIAEEFGANLDEEEQKMVDRGLCKISAEVYLREIKMLQTCFFGEVQAHRERDILQHRPSQRIPVAAAVAWI